MNELDKLWDQFLERWPPEKIEQLTLAEYVDVDNQDTFAYWLERKTRELGSILGGSSFKFGIFRRNNPEFSTANNTKNDSQYTWHERFGDSANQAFELIKKQINDVIRHSKDDDLAAIEKVDLAPTLKWKVAFLYQDRENPVVVNCFSLKALQKACGSNQLAQFECYQQLIPKRGSQHILDYGRELYKKYKPQNEESIATDFKQGTVQDVPLNTILYGPPGTGKTFSTINLALSVLDPGFLKSNSENRVVLKSRFDELLLGNRIGFVTFHQSFSYEDFVEGLKAETVDGNVQYEIEDGIFKRLCEVASSVPKINKSTHQIDVHKTNIWKMSLGNTLRNDGYIYDQCIENDYVVLGYGKKIDFTEATSREKIVECYQAYGVSIEDDTKDYSVTAVQNFRNGMAIGDLVIVSDGNQKFRAVGEIVGDYYFEDMVPEEVGFAQCRKVNWLKVFSPSLPKEEIFNNNLSQMTIYRLKPPTIDLDKLGALINAKSVDQDTSPALSLGDTINEYEITSITKELINFKKPNGSHLPIARSIVDELVRLVRGNKIDLEDIKNKKVFDKVDLNLEKYIVHGYNNLLASFVKSVLENGYRETVAPLSTKRVLIIDEINRGNIANIFGELITLIEPSKRSGGAEALSIKLPYSKNSFSVPSNLYIIGTMNTADKSLAQVDIALRRRFDFVEMMPDYDLLDAIPMIDGVHVSTMLRFINERIELLYDREHTIGHSFFMPLIKSPSLEKLKSIFELQIFPLLEEYFFEDWERVGQVLGDHLKDDDLLKFFVNKYHQNDIYRLMGREWDENLISKMERNSEALEIPEAYIGIYSAL